MQDRDATRTANVGSLTSSGDSAPAMPARRIWVAGWLPLVFIGMIILTGLLTPGEPFFEGRIPGIYLLFKYNNGIIAFLFIGAAGAAIIAVIAFVGRLILRQPIGSVDTLLAVFSLCVIGAMVFFMLVEIFYAPPIYRHEESSRGSGRAYHLAAERYWFVAPGRSGDEPNSGFRYLVIDCGALGVICHRVYASEPIDMDTRQGWYRPEFRQDESSGRLRLIDGKTVLWQSP